MKNRTASRKWVTGWTLTACIICAQAVAAPVDAYYGFVVKDPAAFTAAVSNWLSSKDGKGAKNVSLYRYLFNGENPSTHVVVSQFPDYAGFEKHDKRRAGSSTWAATMHTASLVSKPTGEGFAVHRLKYGKGWDDHEYAAVIGLSVRDTGVYIPALEKFMNSKAAQKYPGATRFIENRAGVGKTTHFVVMTASSFSELNKAMDELFTSDDFREFISQVKDIRSVRGTSFLQRVKTWR